MSKPAFTDFMYEYRHMKIGSAAQYHHLSNEYLNIKENLSIYYPFRFYSNLFINQFGIISILFFGIGLIFMIKEKSLLHSSLLIFFILMLYTITSWQNVATRYLLCLIPISYIFILNGLDIILRAIKQNFKFNYKSYVFFTLASLIMLNQLIVFIKYFH